MDSRWDQSRAWTHHLAPRAICGVVSCAYVFCQRLFLGFVKTNRFTSNLLATRWALGWGASQEVPPNPNLL